MVHFEVSVVPLIVVALVNFFLSWLYYSPAVPWFKAWAKAVDFSPDRPMTEAEKKGMPYLMGGALVASFLLSYGLQIFVHSTGATDFVSGMVCGVVAWAAFAVPLGLNTLFEGRKPMVLVINNVLYLVTYAGFAGLLAVWR